MPSARQKSTPPKPKFGLPRSRHRSVPIAKTIAQSHEMLASTLNAVTNLNNELRTALARKPNQGLQDLVDAVKECTYQLKAQRVELDQLALQLEANTTVVGTLVGRAPKVQG